MPFLKTDRELWDKNHSHQSLRAAQHPQGGGAPRWPSAAAGELSTSRPTPPGWFTSDEAVYSACKGGLISFTKSLARELARKNVLLNASLPAATNTPMMATVLGEGEQAVKWKDAMVRGIPLRRMGEPEDYGGIVAMLASDDGKYITGQTISVSGGMNMI